MNSFHGSWLFQPTPLHPTTFLPDLPRLYNYNMNSFLHFSPTFQPAKNPIISFFLSFTTPNRTSLTYTS